MSKAILKFKLPDEQEEFKDALNGGKYLSVIQDLDEFFRQEIKHGNESDEKKDAFEFVRKEIARLMEYIG